MFWRLVGDLMEMAGTPTCSVTSLSMVRIVMSRTGVLMTPFRL